MVYKNLNIPATLVHTVDGKKYTINGELLSINEAANTCVMKFGNKISRNIPVEEVYLNEAFSNQLKVSSSGYSLNSSVTISMTGHDDLVDGTDYTFGLNSGSTTQGTLNIKENVEIIKNVHIRFYYYTTN